MSEQHDDSSRLLPLPGQAPIRETPEHHQETARRDEHNGAGNPADGRDSFESSQEEGSRKPTRVSFEATLGNTDAVPGVRGGSDGLPEIGGNEFAVGKRAKYHERTGGASALHYRRNTREPAWYAAPPPWAQTASAEPADNVTEAPIADVEAAHPRPRASRITSVAGLKSNMSLLKDMPLEPKWEKAQLHALKSTTRSTMQSATASFTVSNRGTGNDAGGWLPLQGLLRQALTHIPR
eukprot:scaffold138501_cov31-Prasinocladus_malaysianus.AAC.1